MELVWLEDFIALAEHGSFVRAAEARHITQPAFSRRIRTLEGWMGVDLFVRTPQGAPIEAVRLHSDSMANCEQLLSHGQIHFLLSHHHPQVPPLLPPEQYLSRKIGKDRLIPLVSPAAHIDTSQPSIPYLAYTEESGLGRIISHQLQGNAERQRLTPLFSSHLAAVLMSMTLEGKGVAWLPDSLTEQERLDGRLVRALDPGWDIPLDIHLTRPAAPISGFAEEFWQHLDRNGR